MTSFRLGTRGSPLALAQAGLVRDALIAAHGWSPASIALVVIRTTGDRVQDRALAEIGGKALWTRELDRALIAGEIDAAVHSMKDVETLRPSELTIAAMLPRADVRDRLLGAETIAALPHSGVVGTSSPRRRAQLLRQRPDLSVVMLRGNVETRLAKLAAGDVHATLLAAAGLDRLGQHDTGFAVATDTMLPAPAQGAVGIEVRSDDDDAMTAIARIDHADTHRCVLAERGLLAALGATCHSPVGALAALSGETLTLRAELFDEDGTVSVAGHAEGSTGDDLGSILASDLLRRAPDSIRRLFAG